MASNNGTNAAHKKLTGQVADIIAVLKANGLSLPASLDPPAKAEKADAD